MNRICIWMFISASILLFVACDPIESGEVPTFTGTPSVKVLASDQVALSWSPGTDDLVPTDELRYGIWFEEDGMTIDLTSSPDVTTGSGAISFNLTGLTAETTYRAIVRTRDTGLQYSENDQFINFTTPPENSGSFRSPQVGSLSSQPSGIITGFISDQAVSSIGLINGTSILWYSSRGPNFPSAADSQFNVGTDILEAYAVPVDRRSYHDLFVVTASGLIYYDNNEDGVFTEAWRFNTDYVANSLKFFMLNDTLAAFSFIVSGTTGRIYTNDADAQDVTDAFFDRGTYRLPSGTTQFFLDRMDGDNFADMISFGSSGLQIALGTDEEYNFDNATTIDDSITRDNDNHHFLMADGDGDGDLDLYDYVRDENASSSLLHIWSNNGDGTFADVRTTDYAGAIYTDPSFVNSDSDGGADLMFLHPPGYNIAVIQGSSTNFTPVSDYIGTDATPIAAAWGAFDEQAGMDLAIVTSNKLIVLRRLPQASF